jgi:8-oxo-dGTP pyrophosphatase MutT (NUDIX family)
MTLATPGHILLEKDYWEQGDGRPQETKEEQRSLLHRIESDRQRLNPQTETIRTVHVAAALIRLGDKFLMHHREDKKRSGEKSYVLPGGRFNLNDLPVEIQEHREILREILNPDSEIIAQHISRTLEREIKEEIELIRDTHYRYESFGDPLPVYCEVNGAGNRHAYTSYKFYLFQIKLTHDGETRLLDKVSKLTWFSVADIIGPQRSDGASAYVDALRRAWGGNFRNQLLNVPDSSAAPLPYRGESCMLDLPGSSEADFYRGKPGKEKSYKPKSQLNQDEWHLLMLLGWHTRGFLIKDPQIIRLLENGWIDAHNIIELVKSLQDKIQIELPNLIEIREDRYVSLRISPDILFFSPELFAYEILDNNEENGNFAVRRQELETPWGLLQGEHATWNISRAAIHSLRILEDETLKDKTSKLEGEWQKNLRDQTNQEVQNIGLRRVWKIIDKKPYLLVKNASNESWNSDQVNQLPR